MTINPATVGADAYDLLDGSVSSFYAQVDEAIVASELVKGQYRMTINPAYNAPNPVDSNSFTTVSLTQSGPMVVDLENSYITTDVELALNVSSPFNSGNDMAEGLFFVGWKSSIEAIERYVIMVNSTPIYTQSFCGEESFIQYQTVNDLVKNTSPFIYTTYKEASKVSPNVCGTYIHWTQTVSNQTSGLSWTGVKIPIKIPISNFLILKNLKYLMSWMGKWEIRLYFSTQNLICLPIKYSIASSVVDFTEAEEDDDPELAANIINGDSSLTKNFTQIGMPCKWYNYSGGAIVVGGENTLNATKMTLNNVEINTAQFQMRMDIMKMLKQKYMSEKPLTFPVSTIQISRFTGTPDTSNLPASLSIVLCQAINNCDTMFVLIFRNALQHTICTNPYVMDLQLHAGEYGSYPTQPFRTYGTVDIQNIRFVNAVSDALHVNGSQLTSFSRDICNTFVVDPFIQTSGGVADTSYKGRYGVFEDRTNFFIPFPFSTDNDFQGGLSSPASNINFKLTGTLQPNPSEDAADAVVRNDNTFNTPWVACFLIDGAIMVRPDPGSDAAKVILSDRKVC